MNNAQKLLLILASVKLTGSLTTIGESARYAFAAYVDGDHWIANSERLIDEALRQINEAKDAIGKARALPTETED